MKVSATSIIAAFLLQMKALHRTPFVNVDTLVSFSRYLNRISGKREYDFEFETDKEAFLEAGEYTARYFHIMKVHNARVGTETFIQLNYDAESDMLYESFIGSCSYELRRLLEKGTESYIEQIAKIEKSSTYTAMGMCS